MQQTTKTKWQQVTQQNTKGRTHEWLDITK